MAELLYNPSEDTDRVIQLDKDEQHFETYVALLATGVESPEVTRYIIEETFHKSFHNNPTIPRASELFHLHNQDNVRDQIVTSLRDHKISILDGLADLKLLDKFNEKVTLFDADGIIYDVSLRPCVDPDPADNYFGSTNRVAENIAKELGLTGTGMQIEYNPTTNSVRHSHYTDSGIHTSLGYLEDWLGENEHYTPVVTVLNEDHPVRRAIAERQTANE